MVELVISGGQSGADQAGWRAAVFSGISMAGTMPDGFMTEAGPRPAFAKIYNAVELKRSDLNLTEQYKRRTAANIEAADVTILFGDSTSRGSRATYRAWRNHVGEGRHDPGISYCRPGWIHVPSYSTWSWPLPEDTATQLYVMPHRVLNCAGNRESVSPGIGDWVERYLVEVFRIMKGG